MLYCLSIKTQEPPLTPLYKKKPPPETEKKNRLLMEKHSDTTNCDWYCRCDRSLHWNFT